MTLSLEERAHRNGIQTTYHRIDGSLCVARPEVIRLVLDALGERPEPLLPPVIVAWEGGSTAVTILHGHLPGSRTARCTLRIEDGASHRWEIPLAASATSFTLPTHLPWGYHRLTVEFGDTAASSLIVSAPLTAFSDSMRRWGVFLPLYALRTATNWGAGDFSDLRKLIAFASSRGGSITGTLPLLPTQWDKDSVPSPYSSWSRLFWNPFYIDCTAIPEFSRCREARNLARSAGFRQAISNFRASPTVQYHGIMALKQRALKILAHDFLTAVGDRRAQFESYVRHHPDLPEYARFQTTCDHLRTPWSAWPDILPHLDGPQDHYHRYVQWIADEQMARCAAEAHQKNLRLYLDFPIGVHPDGFDAWKYRGVFVPRMKVGAPPDSFFRDGQDWGFQPLHPQFIREDEYNYFIRCLRHHLRYAGILRLDHVMNLHRLFWIPDGFSAQDGVYVRYPAEEFYAILCLESMRHRAVIVGEDLGLVPPEMRSMMRAHGIRRTHITQFDTSPDHTSQIPPDSMAALNTHDLPPFAAFWGARPDAAGALRRYLDCLARSPAEMTLINLEDLWLETEPQNRPGTLAGNWQHKARMTLEEMSEDATINSLLHEVDRLRHDLKHAMQVE